MKKLILPFLCLFLTQVINAQTFGGGSTGAIPDNATQTCYTVNVTGVGTINGAYGVNQVCINATHPWLSDLDIFLRAPDGTMVELTTDNGGSGDNYTNTCFSMSAATSVTAGTAPFTGSYIPEGSMATANNGQNANGTWSLCITDDVGGDAGTLNSWSVSFGAPPPPPVPNTQDCLGAIPVCQNVYNQGTAYSGTGNVANEINSTNSCLGSGEKNDVWYQFTVQTSGNLDFSITPNTMTDDYDWAVYNLTSNNCSDIYSNTALEVSCNFSGLSGVTGPNGSPGTQNEPVIPVTAGQTYVINVSQFTTSTAGYSLDFGASTATIFDNIAPSINSLTSTPTCGATSFSFNMSENILCSTVSAADFTLAGPGGPYTVTGITGSACSVGAPSENTFTVTTTPAITTSGTYSLCLVGTSGSVTDLCGNVAAPGCFNFTVTGPTVAVTPTNPNCSTGTGSVTSVGSGGSGAPYTYSLNGAAFQASGNYTGLAAGSYTVRTRDGGGCMGQNTFTITIPPAITTTAVPTNATCAGNNGSINLTPGGGTPGYTYSWAPSGGTGQDPTGLSPNTYTVTVTDSRGCTATATAVIAITGTVTATFTNSPNQCLNGNTFTFTNTGSAGGGITHAWTFPSGTPGTSAATSPGGVTWAVAGSYTVTHQVTQGSCVATNTVQVTIYPRPNGPALTPVQPTCGANNGAINVTAATGGTPAYQYSLNAGGFTALTNYTGQGPGTYTVNVRDANGCTNTSTVTLTNVPGPTAIATTIATAHCGQSDGSITLGAVTGGTAAYSYSVTPTVGFSGTTLYTGQATGTHTVTVRDANNCTYTTTVNVPNAAGPTGPNATSTNASCGASNGTVTLAPPTTGTGPFTYNFNGAGFAATTNFTGLAAGTYNYVVRDNFGCTLNGSIAVGTNAGPTALALTPTPSTCGNANGQIVIGAVTGGTAAFTYSFNNPAGPFTATSPITALSAGTYSVTVRDANGCVFTQTTVVANTAGPTDVVLTPTQATCGASNGQITIGAVTGGTAAYTYSFNNPAGPYTATSPITGQAAGTYSVTVRDNNGCLYTETVAITNSSGPTAVTATVTASSCTPNDGTVTITGQTGGVAPFTYSFNGSPFTATTNYTGIAPGTYNVSVRDNNGCQAATTVTVGISPSPTAQATTTTSSTCGNPNGVVTIGATTGGTAAYSYSFDGGAFVATTSYTVAAGTHTVVVRDSKGCTFTVNPVVTNTPGPTAQATTTNNSTCGNTNGVVNIGATTGGTAAYTYSFDGSGFTGTTSYTVAAGTHTVIVRDANNCTFTVNPVVTNTPGPTAQATSTTNSTCGNANGVVTIGATTGGTAAYTYSFDAGAFSATTSYTVASGTHTVVVSDANSCTFTVTATVNNTAGPTALALTQTPSTCGNANGQITIGAVTGGTAAYTYSFNGGPFTATSPIIGLASGSTYTVAVQDANGCTFQNTIAVTNTPGPTDVVLTPTDATCGAANGSVTIGAVTGGTGAYTYSFDGGAFSGTTNYPLLVANTYAVIVQDANGCQYTETVAVSNSGGPTGLTATTTASSCTPDNGTVTITGQTGGVGPYTYSFNGSAFTGTMNYNGIAPGTYPVAVKDANNCQFAISVTIAITPSPTAQATTTTNSTCGNANGTVTFGATTGGTGPYTYSFNGGAFGATTTYTVAAGTYNIAVQDANGCQFASTATISDTPGPTAQAISTTNSTCGNANGVVTAGLTTGGTSPYTFSFDAGVFGATTTYTTSAGTHTVVVSDVNNCTFTVTAVVADTPGPTAQANTTTNSTCGNANGVVTIGATTGGTAVYTYNFDGGAFSATTSYTTAAGTHTVGVQDANNCTYTVTVDVFDSPAPTAIAITPTPSTCGNSNGQIAIGAVTGGVATYSFSVNAGASTTTTTYTGLAAATYTVEVTDGNGCVFSTTTNISDTPGPTAVVTTPVDATCGASNGSITIGAVTGGTAPYQYSVDGGSLSGTINYTGLAASTHTVIVSDANACTFTTTVAVGNSGGPTAIAATPTPSSCVPDNGTVTITGQTGGAAPFTYSFNGSPFTATTNYTGIAPGTYAVAVSDGNGCQFTDNVTIAITPSPTAQAVTTTDATCGNANGTVTFGATTDGTAPYTYSFNGSAFSATTTYTSGAGTFNIIVQDVNGCQFTSTTTLNDIPGPTAQVITPVNSTCSNANGEITLGVTTGGTAPYTFSLNGGAPVPSGPFTGLTASNYTIVVQDANACTFTVTTTVADTPSPTDQAVTNTSSSCGGANGTITIGATTGGTPAYQFSLNGGALSATTTYTVSAGTHTITVSDANNCTYSVTTIVTDLPGPTALPLGATPSNCGNPNGTITVGVVTGGAPAYEYSIDGVNFQASVSFTGLLPAIYTVTVKDANNCILTNTVDVTNLGSPVASVSAQTNVSCNGGNNGSVTFTAVGGAGGFTYTLNTGATNGTGIFGGLVANTYTVTVTDAAGCITTETVTITEPVVLAGSIQAQTEVSCFGGNNGSVTVTQTGGTAPYTYSLNGGAFGASATFGGLIAASYTVTVEDNLGCQFDVPVTISEPTALVLAFSSVNANCTDDNGTATVTPSGGTSGYTQAWTGGGGTATTTIPLVAGTYSVTVTDANGCTATGNTTIGVTPGGTATMSGVTNVTCNAAANGSMTVSMGGGSTAPFSYVWTPNVGNTATVTGLAPGTYSVTVTDDHGCIATTNAAITEPLVLNVSFTSTNVSCNGGSDGTISSNVTGGTAPYTYSWSPGAFNTAVISGLPVGAYSLTATDANGCTVTGTRTLTEPTALAMTPVISDPHCNQADGSATVTGSGGAGGYTFSMNGGPFGPGSFTNLSATTYTITLQDANLCQTDLPLTLVDLAGPTATITASSNVNCNGGNNGSATVSATGGSTPYNYVWTPSAQTTQTASNLSAGVYGVVVTDANGCNAGASIIITEPDVLQINATGTDPVCNGQSTGTGSAAAFGGTTPYAFQWAVLPVQNTANATNLPSGNHNVTVTDANGCTATTSIVLVNPPLLTVTINETDVTCNGACNGTASAVTNNGTSPFLYVWSDPNAQSTQTATGLCAGTFTLDITDFKGCTASAATNIVEPTLLTTSIINPLDVSCSGVCDGSGTVSPAGGTTPYAYSWSNSVTTPVNNNICAGSYSATVTDANGCTSQSTLVVNTPNPLVINVASTNATCYNLCDGTATANFSGGTAPYNFVWQPSLASVFNPTALCDGTHTVTITDANGCSQTATTVITEPSELIASTVVNGNNFCGQSNGSAQVQVSGGTSPFSYLWTNGSTFALNTNLAGGVYSVNVTDGNGCVVNAVANVNDIPAPTLTLTSSTDITCFGLNNGIGVIGVVGGTTPYTAQEWLLPSTLMPNPDQTGNALWPGNNVYQVVDAAGCVSSITVPIVEPTELVSLIANTNHVTCNGLSNGNSTMLVNGGTTPYTYQWTDLSAQTVATAVGLAAGTYTCNVTDANGCPTSQSVTITQPLPLVIITNSAINVNCYGAGDGSINITPTGGTPAYTYSWSPNSADVGSVVTNLVPATYVVQVEDGNGCLANSAYNISQPDSFKVDITTIPSRCTQSNASISLVVSGASPGFTYSWNTSPLQTSASATNLAAPGTYNCIITDSHGCTKPVSATVNDIPPPSIDSISVTNISCFGLLDGMAVVYPKAGSAAGTFSYNWTQGSTSVGQTQLVNGLGVGTYNVVVTETFTNPAGSCDVIGTATITQPLQLYLTTSADQTVCNGQTIGVSATGGNGTPGYTYSWTGTGASTFTTGGNHNLTFTNNTSSTIFEPYTVSINDANNCGPIQKTFTITVLPKITATAPAVTGCMGESVTLNASAVGGDGAPYTYTWGTSPVFTETGATSSTTVAVTSSLPSVYNITVDDGCSTPENISITVSSNPTPNASLIGINTEGCADLAVSFSGSGGLGFPGCTYGWSFGDNTTGSDSAMTHTYTSTGLQTDMYTVELTVTTPLGCSDTATMTNYVTVYPNPVAEFTFDPLNTTEFDPVINFYNQSLLGDTYSWNFGELVSLSNTSADVDPMHTYLNPGYYDVNLVTTTDKGCTAEVTHQIYIEPEFAIYVPNAFTPNEDTKNELFGPQGIGISNEKYHMYIYNRWGELIFESNDLNKGWDGTANGKSTIVQEDVYVWKILAYDLKKNKHNLTGHVTVVR